MLQTLPSWPSAAYHAPRYAPVLPLWEAAGVPVHNVLAPLVARYGEAPLAGPQALRWGINPADGHPGPRMTHFFARMAADYLEAHHRPLLGPQEPGQPQELVINDTPPAGLNLECTAGDERHVTYAWSWPTDTGRLAVLPLGRPGVQMALRWPVALQRVELAGEGLVQAVVRACWLDPQEGCDENEWIELGRWSGPRGACDVPPERRGRPLTQLRIEADVRPGQRQLVLTLHREAP